MNETLHNSHDALPWIPTKRKLMLHNQTQPREKLTGKFTTSSRAESEVVLVALDRDNHPLGTRRPTKARKLTHAVIKDAETPSAVTRRAQINIQHDSQLLEKLQAATGEEPRLHKAGRPSDGLIAARPPQGLENYIQPVYGPSAAAAKIKDDYRQQLSVEIANTQLRIKAAQATLQSLDDGTYELREAEILKWVTSFQAARQHITKILGHDTNNTSKLYIGEVVAQPV